MFHLKFRPVRRVKQEAEIAGLCAGLAYAVGAHVAVIRFLMLMATFLHPAVVLVYVIGAVVMPKWPEVPHDYAQVVHKMV